jgi:hypothetical protein
MHDKLIEELSVVVKEKVVAYLREQSVMQLASLSWVQQLVLVVCRCVGQCVFEAWKAALVQVAETLGRICPGCGQRRRLKWKKPMRIEVLGVCLALPKPYLECGRCGAGGVSIIKVLTGLRSGDASVQLKLLSAYCGAKQSYGKACQELEVHHGHSLERTKLRRMALEMEGEAMAYAERQRQAALEDVAQEARKRGIASLMVEGDGGKVRTGKLVPCEPSDPGYGKRTSRGSPRRKRPPTYRELITLDVRPPGAMEPSATDVLVPVVAEPGERARRMLACAARSGLGSSTTVHGLGDMGSELASSFDEAFFDYPGCWSADWTHTREYVDAAAKVLEEIDAESWATQLKEAIWSRDAQRREELCEQARCHRVAQLPAVGYEKCPVSALTTYLRNNWRYMHFADKKAQGLPIVSARAEAQVRDRTKDRFCVAGAWAEQNLESKATLRSIIFDGRWESLCSNVLQRSVTEFQRDLMARLQQAVQQGKLCADRVKNLVLNDVA